MIHGIVCCAKDWAIGKQNGLLFDIPADMKFFVEQTRGTIIVMGYSTYLSLPKRPLKNRVNVVLWDKATSIDCLEGCITFNNFNDLLHFCKTAATTHKVVICGGGTIYKLFAPYYDHVWVTKVDAVDPEATVFFPNLDDYSEFECISESTPEESNGYTIRFTEYKRK